MGAMDVVEVVWVGSVVGIGWDRAGAVGVRWGMFHAEERLTRRMGFRRGMAGFDGRLDGHSQGHGMWWPNSSNPKWWGRRSQWEIREIEPSPGFLRHYGLD